MSVNGSTSEECGQIRPRLSGYMVVGWDKVPSKSRWVVFSCDNCKLYVFKTEHDPVPIKDLDISHAVFLYDVEKSDNGVFCIRCGGESVLLDAGNLQRRNYWLNSLRQERRSFAGRCTYLVQHRELWPHFALRGLTDYPQTGLLSPTSKSSTSQVHQTAAVEPLVTLRHSANDDDHEKSPSSSSDQRAQKVTSQVDGTSNPSTNTFSSLGKRIRHSFREKRRSLRLSVDSAQGCNTPATNCDSCKQFSSQVSVLKDDLRAAEDECEASRQVIEILQAQVEVLTRENEVLLEAGKRASKSGESEILQILQDKEVDLTALEQQCRKLSTQVEQMQNDAAVYKELLQAKDCAIVELTNQLDDCKTGGRARCSVAVQTDKTGDSESSAIEAYSEQNKFLNEELLEINRLLQESVIREDKLLVEAREWEARFYQIHSKYMLLLNELQTPESCQNSPRFRELVLRLMGDSVTENIPSLRCSNKTYNVYGFQQEVLLRDKPPVTQEFNTKQLAQWDGVVTSLENLELQLSPGLKALVRSGIPYHLRGRVWKAVMEQHLRGSQDYCEPEFYKRLFKVASQPHISPSAKQIETDLLRTLPKNKHYECMNSDGIPKLRRVLLAFSIYNAGGYCQGLNRIVAILLLFLSEEDAFWGLVYIVEKLMPSDYYGHQLKGAQVDQRVLKDLIAEKLPRLASHLADYGVDISLVTFNWFLCIFVDSLPVDLFLQVWDAFLFEGSKVLFRYTLAVLKMFESEILQHTDYMGILSTLKKRVENIIDVEAVARVAFQDLNPFPMKIISQKRDCHLKSLKLEFEKLEAVRREYKQKVMGAARASEFFE